MFPNSISSPFNPVCRTFRIRRHIWRIWRWLNRFWGIRSLQEKSLHRRPAEISLVSILILFFIFEWFISSKNTITWNFDNTQNYQMDCSESSPTATALGRMHNGSLLHLRSDRVSAFYWFYAIRPEFHFGVLIYYAIFDFLYSSSFGAASFAFSWAILSFYFCFLYRSFPRIGHFRNFQQVDRFLDVCLNPGILGHPIWWRIPECIRWWFSAAVILIITFSENCRGPL